MAELRLTLLGEFGLSTSARCAILNKKAQALLAFLAMPPGRAHRREKLASMLWGDRSEESARQNLRQCLTAIRRACPTGEALPVVTEGDSLRLNTTHVTVDVSEFEEALREPDPAGLGRVFTLYRGELLEGLSLPAGSFEEWLIGERRRLTALAIRALTQLLEHQERSGRHEDAMQTALRLLTIDPLQEAVHRALMRLHHETGNTAQALRQFGICEKILRRELNVEPEAATRELRRDILRSRSQPGSVHEQREARPIEVRPAQTGTSGRGSGQQNRTAAEGDQSVEGIVSRGGPGEPMSHAPSNGPPLPNAIEILRELDAPLVPSDRPSVAVIPFHSYSDDPRHAAIADAICEDITTTLSGLPRLMVIACSSSLCYKGKTVDARTAGRELGVAHVLEGSVRILGSRVRISAQLVDTSSGAHVWADRYDRETEDAFGVPDEITQEIVTALEVKLTHGEQIRAWRRDAVSPEAYQHFVRGREAYLTFSRSAMGRAREELEHAISINANFATAHVLLGFTHAEDARFQWGSSREEALSKARAAARKGLALNAGCGAAHSLLAYVAMQDRRFDDAIGEGGRAVAIGPSDAEAYHVLAMARIYNGDFAEGIRLERRSLRLNLLALENHLVMLGRAYFHMGRFDDAIGVLERVRQRKPYWLSARTLLAGCFAQSGRLQLARQTATEILRIRPDFSTGRWAQLQPYRRPQDLDRYLSSLHAAGLPASSRVSS